MEIDVIYERLPVSSIYHPGGIIRLRKVFKPIILENEEGEQIRVMMVDGGFEVIHKEDVMVIEKVED